ncbi:MAG TPA: hypothetical protein VI462_10025 [Acidimicrobiia bacterium]
MGEEGSIESHASGTAKLTPADETVIDWYPAGACADDEPFRFAPQVVTA